MVRSFILVLLLIAGTVSFTAATPPEPSAYWLHVKVDQTGPERETVRLNLPIRLVSEVLPLIAEGDLQGGFVRLDSLGVHGDIDLRKMLAALKDADDGEYVTVERPDEKVRVVKEKGLLLIHVDEAGPVPQKVDIKVRMDVLEALLSGPPGQLNVSAAIAVLGSDEAELVTVREADETVRIWVDTRPTAD